MANLVRPAVYEEKCPSCGKENYYDGEDPSDFTGSALEVLQCWSCGEYWFVEGVEVDWELLYPEFDSKKEALCEAIENGFVEKGRNKI